MTLINDFLSLIYPRRCEACGHPLYRHERFVCSQCRLSLPRAGWQAESARPASVFAGRVPAQRAETLFVFERSGRVQKLLHAVKYEGQKELAQWLGQWYAKAHAEVLADVDCVLPVPLHPDKLKARGYNQSAWFARGLSGAVQLVPEDSVRRLKYTESQTGKKKYARWESVEGIFDVREPNRLAHHHVLIVDDVITTGATVESLWMALKDIEGIRVSVAAIAFATRS